MRDKDEMADYGRENRSYDKRCTEEEQEGEEGGLGVVEN